MKNYSLTKAQIEVIRPVRLQFVTAAAVTANERFGRENEPPRFLMNDEGGIVVNGREIHIAREFVLDLKGTWKKDNVQTPCVSTISVATPEEAALADAIVELAGRVEKEGPAALAAYANIAPAEDNPQRNAPFHCLFRTGIFETPTA